MKKLNLNRPEKKINYNRIISKRFLVFFVVLLIMFGVLGIKLYTVMIIDSKDYKKSLKELSYTKVEGTSAPRGRIYDKITFNFRISNSNIN